MRVDVQLLLMTTAILSFPSPCLCRRAQLPSSMRRHMNRLADPCKDFYEYACGNWMWTHQGRPYRSLLEQLDHVYHGKLAKLLDQPPPQAAKEPRFVRMLRDYYTACRTPLEATPSAEFVLKLCGMAEVDGNELAVALTALFQTDVLLEIADSNLAAVWAQLILRPSAEGDRNASLHQPLSREQFDQLWRRLPAPEETPDEVWPKVKELEEAITAKVEKDALGWLPDTTTDNAGTLFPVPAYWMLPWPTFETGLSYVAHLSQYLASQPPRFLLHYLLLRSLHRDGERVPWSFTRLECAAQGRLFITHAAVWLVEQHHPRLQANGTLQGLFGELKQRFGLKLKANRNKFSAATQRFLLEKLERMSLRLSILPSTEAVESVEERVEQHYKQLRINATDYFGNLLAVMEHSRGQAENPATKYDLHPVKVHGYGSYASPFFMPMGNALLVPLSLLEAPLYRPEQRQVLTYSSLGFILGHELSHGFAPVDVHFDAFGQPNRSKSLSMLTSRRFLSQVLCLHRRHGMFIADEKFADLNGLDLAYGAYFEAGGGPGRCTPAQKQLFFFNFAQFFCSDDRNLEDSEEHGSDRRRVNDAMASFDPFRQAYGCKSVRRGSRTRCQLY
ncbi:endothelin-converting enzyme-like 1 [Drosophila persimilis]|uniref:endothelin-converting enzyme-like 1 n=1 Tax=Drosophila persimilis TaxID=7234 RepID=UPI000F086E75|nr:endothelin-converting enzyme-like 1 [Drosophila persimilis]